MSNRVNEPDPQHAMLDALNEAIDEACARLDKMDGITSDDIQGCFPSFNEELGYAGYQSVCFTGDDLAGYDPDEAYDIVMAVGSRDLDIKINEARTTLRNLNDLLDPPRYDEDGDRFDD